MAGEPSANKGYKHIFFLFCGNEINGVLGHDSAFVRLYWNEDNMG